MSISGVGQNFYRNNVETIKNANSTEKFALEKTGNTKKFFLRKRVKRKTIRRNCWKNIWKNGRRLRDSNRSC